MKEIKLSNYFKEVLICHLKQPRHMDARRHEGVISAIFASIIAIGLYMLITWGVVTLSDVGAAIAAVLITAALGALWWGWKDKVERWLKGPKEHVHKKEEMELQLLISPLYAKLNKNDEIIDFMTTYKISRLDIYSDSQRVDGNDQRKELEKLEEEIKDIMLQHGHLASGRLYDLIKKYQDLKPDWEQDNRFEAKKVLWEIQKITGERQDELRELILKN